MNSAVGDTSDSGGSDAAAAISASEEEEEEVEEVGVVGDMTDAFAAVATAFGVGLEGAMRGDPATEDMALPDDGSAAGVLGGRVKEAAEVGDLVAAASRRASKVLGSLEGTLNSPWPSPGRR